MEGYTHSHGYIHKNNPPAPPRVNHQRKARNLFMMGPYQCISFSVHGLLRPTSVIHPGNHHPQWDEMCATAGLSEKFGIPNSNGFWSHSSHFNGHLEFLPIFRLTLGEEFLVGWGTKTSQIGHFIVGSVATLNVCLMGF